MGQMVNGEQWLVTIDQAIDETNESRRKWIKCKTSRDKRDHGSVVLPWVLWHFQDFLPWKVLSFKKFTDFQWPSTSDQVVPTYINEVSPTALRGALGAVFQLACVPLAAVARELRKGRVERRSGSRWRSCLVVLSLGRNAMSCIFFVQVVDDNLRWLQLFVTETV